MENQRFWAQLGFKKEASRVDRCKQNSNWSRNLSPARVSVTLLKEKDLIMVSYIPLIKKSVLGDSDHRRRHVCDNIIKPFGLVAFSLVLPRELLIHRVIIKTSALDQRHDSQVHQRYHRRAATVGETLSCLSPTNGTAIYLSRRVISKPSYSNRPLPPPPYPRTFFLTLLTSYLRELRYLAKSHSLLSLIDCDLTFFFPTNRSALAILLIHTINFNMDSIQTHPSSAVEAKKFIAPGSLSFPGGAVDITPPSTNEVVVGKPQPQQQQQQQQPPMPVAPVAASPPATPATTPAATQGVSGIVPTLQNIVATVNLDCRLDLKTIALHARNAEYNPKRFAAVIMRIRDPKTTALIFASGKMVVTGAKSEDDSKLASRKYARIIQKLGFNAKFTDFKIQNIVGSCDIKFPIRLEGLASRHMNFSSYEPELFPGLIYRMMKPKIVLLIFVSGKIVLTGAKSP
ncbi:hypothetical protein EYC84_010257 [Monilinia fructicola]|uniref:TATA-box-binding protein n=1 Tax=Monilinia fructicola TaxID=38448 RepID=A0A5M9JD63_MONFR|nr:hypothetical protein EYC84_010257 [Monilinia fructicola]